MKYIITWILIKYSSGACPPQTPVTDGYGRVYNSYQVNVVACFDFEKRNMQKEFSNRDSAISFYKSIKKECRKQITFTLQEVIDSVKIDSIKIII